MHAVIIFFAYRLSIPTANSSSGPVNTEWEKKIIWAFFYLAKCVQSVNEKISQKSTEGPVTFSQRARATSPVPHAQKSTITRVI